MRQWNHCGHFRATITERIMEQRDNKDKNVDLQTREHDWNTQAESRDGFVTHRVKEWLWNNHFQENKTGIINNTQDTLHTNFKAKEAQDND